VEIYENEMDVNMTANIIGHAGALFNRYNDTQNITSGIVSFIQKEYEGTSWHVIIGDKQLAVKISHVKGSYIRFSFKDHFLFVFRLV